MCSSLGGENVLREANAPLPPPKKKPCTTSENKHFFNQDTLCGPSGLHNSDKLKLTPLEFWVVLIKSFKQPVLDYRGWRIVYTKMPKAMWYVGKYRTCGKCDTHATTNKVFKYYLLTEVICRKTCTVFYQISIVISQILDNATHFDELMSTVTTSRLGYDKQHCSFVAPFFLKGLPEADWGKNGNILNWKTVMFLLLAKLVDWLLSTAQRCGSCHWKTRKSSLYQGWFLLITVLILWCTTTCYGF